MVAQEQEGGEPLPPGSYTVVAWDLDTTGRRLIDEICQIGGHCRAGKEGRAEETFSQYVMPYRNPNPGARRSFGIKVVNIGRYRMLKDVNSGKILKTKSEVSALQDFISWLESCRGSSEGVLLVAHEPQRKVVVPLLLEALAKYRLEESFKAVVSGFVSSSDAIEALGDSNTITSLSLRSLCKTVLGDTSLPTSSATQRCSALLAILARVVAAEGAVVPADKLLPFSTSVAAEQRQLGQLKDVLGTQGTLRPIFEAQLKQKRVVRERAMALRRTIAEAGLEYERLAPSLVEGTLGGRLEGAGATREDVAEIEALVREHFNLGEKEGSRPVVTKVEKEAVKGD